MSKRQVTTYTEEFKRSSAKLAAESSQPIAQTARELGVNINTLHGWVTRYCPQRQVPTTELSSDPQEEIKRLRKELARVTQERDILKKATKYFANETT